MISFNDMENAREKSWRELLKEIPNSGEFFWLFKHAGVEELKPLFDYAFEVGFFTKVEETE